MTDIIRTHDLKRHFGEIRAVDGVSLDVQQGEIFGLLGHNGAGKTTTVRLLNGVLTPTGGSMRVLGYDPLADGVALRRRTGVLTETPALYEALTGEQNLTLFAELYHLDPQQIARRVQEVLEQFGLADRATEKTGGYSKGMKQRLALARAFLHEPELLFLDEPTSGLDPVAAQQVHDLIQHLSHDKQRTVVLATHDLHLAQNLCNRVAVMEQGRVVASGSPADLAQQHVQKRTIELTVAADQQQRARTVLQNWQSLQVAVNPQSRTLLVEGLDYDAIPQMLHHLLDAHIDVYAVVPQQPSLQDVYFNLHRVHQTPDSHTEKELV